MSWLQTFTGKAFYPLDPKLEDVDIRDIAHSLALQCRFAGHVREFYSVAEHSVRVARRFRSRHPTANPKLVLGALMHDFAEAYLVDLPRPIKNSPEFLIYRQTERQLVDRLAPAFGLEPWMLESDAVKNADAILLATEARDLMSEPPQPGEALPPPLPEKIVPWDWKTAELTFLNEYLDHARDLGLGYPKPGCQP